MTSRGKKGISTPSPVVVNIPTATIIKDNSMTAPPTEDETPQAKATLTPRRSPRLKSSSSALNDGRGASTPSGDLERTFGELTFTPGEVKRCFLNPPPPV